MSRAVAYAYDLLHDDRATKRRRKQIAMKRKVLIDRVQKLRRNIAKGGRRSRIDRDFAEFQRFLIAEWFGRADEVDGEGNVIRPGIKATQADPDFRTRYRMGRHLFLKIYEDIIDPMKGCKYFRKEKNRAGIEGPSALMKLVAAFRQLCYGIPAHLVEEISLCRKDCARKSLIEFCQWVEVRYAAEFLGVWKEADFLRELKINEERGFPGMLGSIDCTHWTWRCCPHAWQGMFQGRNKKRSVVMEAVASKDLYFWHAFVGVPGSCNDINCLDRSPFALNYLQSRAKDFPFLVNGKQYHGAYFLADDIYPPHSYFMKTVPIPNGINECNFAKEQESVRKDVERAFGILQTRFWIVCNAARTHKLENLIETWRACVILHNMIFRDEQVIHSFSLPHVTHHSHSNHNFFVVIRCR